MIGGCSLLARCTGVHRPGLYAVCVWGVIGGCSLLAGCLFDARSNGN